MKFIAQKRSFGAMPLSILLTATMLCSTISLAQASDAFDRLNAITTEFSELREEVGDEEFEDVYLPNIWSIIVSKYQAKQTLKTGEQRVRDGLIDGQSAIFRNVYVLKPPFQTITCGQVNAKNSYGAYIGYQGFISAKVTVWQKEFDDSRNTWNLLHNIICNSPHF